MSGMLFFIFASCHPLTMCAHAESEKLYEMLPVCIVFVVLEVKFHTLCVLQNLHMKGILTDVE